MQPAIPETELFEPVGPTGRRTLRRCARVCAACFPVVVWVLACFFYFGQLGPWNDDYQLTQIDPATGGYGRLSEDLEGMFWRPLHVYLVPGLLTLLWNHLALMHALLAAVHGATALAVRALLLELGRSRRAAGGAAIVYLVWPATFQTIFWLCCLSTSVANLLLVVLTIQFIRWVRRRARVSTGSRDGCDTCPVPEESRARRRWRFAGMLLLAAAIVCLNEQPAAGIAVLPLAAWAAGVMRANEPGEARTRRHRWAQAIAGAAVLAIPTGIYLAAYLSTAYASYPGSASTRVPWTRELLVERGAALAAQVSDGIVLGSFRPQVFEHAAGALAARPAWSISLAIALGVAGAMWLVRWARSRTEPADDGVAVSARRRRIVSRLAAGELACAAYGLALFAISWAPIFVVVTYSAQSRLFTTGLIGLAAVGAGLIDLFDRAAVRSGAMLDAAWRWMSGVLLASVLAWGSLQLVGVQHAWRQTWLRDIDIARRLERAIPEAAPNSFFWCTGIEDPSVHQAATALDLATHTVWRSSYSSADYIRLILGRNDIFCGSFCPGIDEYPRADEAALTYRVPFGAPKAERTGRSDPVRIPWARVIPFRIEHDGGIAFATSVLLMRADNTDVEIPLAQGAAAARNSGGVPFMVTRWDASADGRVVPVSGWVTDGGVPARFEPMQALGGTHTARALSENQWMQVIIRPGLAARARLAFRVVPAARSSVSDAPAADAVVVFELAPIVGEDREPAHVLARVELGAALAAGESAGAWRRITIDLPESRPGDALRVRCVQGSALVTHGLLITNVQK